MSDEKSEALKDRVRAMPLQERLSRARTMIGKMCSEKRSPKMSIPVSPDDEDFFITTTLDDALAALSLPSQREEVVRLLGLIYAAMPEEPGSGGGPDALLLWVREWAIEKMGGGEDEGWAWIRRKLQACCPELLIRQRSDGLASTKWEVMGWMHVLCSYAQSANNCYLSIAVEQEKRATEQEERATRAMKLLERAVATEMPAPDETWFQEYFALTGEHMILTDEGWEPGSIKGAYTADKIIDEVNAPDTSPRP